MMRIDVALQPKRLLLQVADPWVNKQTIGINWQPEKPSKVSVNSVKCYWWSQCLWHTQSLLSTCQVTQKKLIKKLRNYKFKKK